MEFIKPGWRFDFMGKRRYFIAGSLVMLALSILSFIYPGPKLGTDFKGGTEVEVAFKGAISASAIEEALKKADFRAPDVIAAFDADHPHKYLIRVQEVSSISDAQRDALKSALCVVEEGAAPRPECKDKPQATEIKFSPGGDRISTRYESTPDLAVIREQAAGARVNGQPAVALAVQEPVKEVSERDHKVEIALQSKGDQLMAALKAHPQTASLTPERPTRIEWIGAKATTQLRDDAIKSVAIAIVFIMAYIAFRFDLRFAPGGIVALVHDVGIALGAMILTGREITLSTIAALLTIVGYSITDTVIVYDRIRENFTRHRNLSFAQIVNLSVSEMFGRTIISSGTTTLSMIAFLVFGTGVLKDFAFALLVGILIGTFSSIYVAAPITEWIDKRFFGGKTAEKKPVPRKRAVRKADAVV